MSGEPYVGGLKQTFKHKGQCCAISRWKARPAVKISLALHAVLLMPLGDHAGHEMCSCGLTALEKSCLQVLGLSG